jgi:predicted acylesterase/phospholipase RssA
MWPVILRSRPLERVAAGHRCGSSYGSGQGFRQSSIYWYARLLVSSEVLARTARSQTDILFKPPLENVGLLDWEAYDTAIEAGYRFATQHLEHLAKSALLPKVLV